MSEVKLLATVIGDVVDSRKAPDRSAVHTSLLAALEQVNRASSPVIPLRITVGDEYQGGFATVGEALAASLRLRILLLPGIDVRHGLGWGTVTVLSEEPRVEDGPGWWSARDAIGTVSGRGPEQTAYRRGEGTGPQEEAVNAALVTRDALIAAASPRSVGVLRGLLAGMSQKEIAEAQGVSPSAVSQRIRRDGLAAVVASDVLLGQVR